MSCVASENPTSTEVLGDVVAPHTTRVVAYRQLVYARATEDLAKVQRSEGVHFVVRRERK